MGLEGRLARRVYGLLDEWMERWMDGWMDGWMDSWMGRWYFVWEAEPGLDS
jgi:hypothetical protein